MGFNFGAFAGGLAKGGMDTYTTMKSLESQARRDELLNEQIKEAQAARAEREGISQAGKDTYGRVGGAEYAPELQRTTGIGPQQAQGLAVNTGAGGADFDRAVAESDQAVLRENAVRQGSTALPTDTTMTPGIYTEAQADKDYAAKLRAINPIKAREARLQGLQIEGAEQGVKTGGLNLKTLEANHALSEWLTQQHADLIDPAKGPVAVLQSNLEAYNKGQVHKDGMTASIVEGADGSKSLVRVNDKTGKTIDSTPITPDTAAKAIEAMAFNRWKAIPGNFKEGLELGLKERTVGAAETSAAATRQSAETHSKELAEKVNAGLFGAQAGLARAQAGQANAHSALYNNMVKMANEKSEAGLAMKPFIERFAALTPEEQAGTIGQGILTEGALAAAKKSGDVTGLLAQLKKPDRSGVSAEMEKGYYAETLGVTDPNKLKETRAKFPAMFPVTDLTQKVNADLKGELPKPAAVVSGRPLYNTPYKELQRLATRPRGVSVSESNDAQTELTSRKGESRISAIPQ